MWKKRQAAVQIYGAVCLVFVRSLFFSFFVSVFVVFFFSFGFCFSFFVRFFFCFCCLLKLTYLGLLLKFDFDTPWEIKRVTYM